MWDSLDTFKQNDQEGKLSDLADWIYDSHDWQEYRSGQFKCLWCGQYIGSVHAVWTLEKPLCRGNPAVKKLLSEDRVLKTKRRNRNAKPSMGIFNRRSYNL